MLRFIPSLLLLAPVSLAGDLFVDANLNTGLDDGSSWDNAFQGERGLKDASNAAVSGDRIFVAQGTYKPAIGSNRNISINLTDGVEIYGGFLGGESSPADRPPFGTAPTILDGDLGDNDDMGMFGDNSYHCIRSGSAGPTAVVDGLVIRAGNSNGTGTNDTGGGILCLDGAPTIRNCHFLDHRCTFGGAAGYINGAGPTFTECIFENGDGGSFGGAFDIATGQSTIVFDRCLFKNNIADRAGALEIFATTGTVVTNCVFVDNESRGSGGGGGMWVGSGGTTTITNCSFVANRSTVQNQGGLRNQGSTANVANCIFWDNEGPGGSQNSNNQIGGAGTTVSYSLVEGGFTGTGNLSGDPMFVDLASRDLSLGAGSPAIDAADNTQIAPVPFDQAHAPRYVNDPNTTDTGVGTAPIVDMGAYEASIGISDRYCIAADNSTGGPSLLVATGSLAVADNDVDLVVSNLPMNEFGYFLMSETRTQIPAASGILCLGGPQYRFNTDVLNSGSAGGMAFSPDLNNLPSGVSVAAGDTWYFQLWHRDGATSNFSSSLCFTWE